MGIERGDAEFVDQNNDANHSYWSPTTLAVAAVVPKRHHAAADSQPDSAESRVRQGANELNPSGGASESGISGAARNRPEDSEPMRSESFQAAMLQVITALHDTPR